MAKVKFRTVRSYRKGFKFWQCFVYYEIIYEGRTYRTRELLQDEYEGDCKEKNEEEIKEYSSEEEFISQGWDDEINNVLKGTPLYYERKPKVCIVDKPRGWTISINGTAISQKKTKNICENYELSRDTIVNYMENHISNIQYDYYGNVSFFLK